MRRQPTSHQHDFDRKNINISPAYLVAISDSVDALNKFYEQEQMGTLSAEYKHLITNSFKNLSQSIQIYESTPNDSKAMIQSSILKCKSELEVFCLDKLGVLLGKESPQLAKIVNQASNFYRENFEDYEKILLTERRKRLEDVESEKDYLIQKLRDQLIQRVKHNEELNERISQVQKQNSILCQRVINHAKNTIEQTLNSSPRRPSQLDPALTKIKQQLKGNYNKTVSGKQVEETIHDIMETKQKREGVKGKRVNMQQYMKMYFRNRFGMKQLADESENNFKDALFFYIGNSEKSLFILFQKILEEECEQQYFWEQKNFYDKITKILKRYLNEKEGIPLDELQKMYDTKLIDQRTDVPLNQKDVQYILVNAYKKTSEENSLQVILNQIILPKLQQSSQNSETLLIPSKKLINEILNYQLHTHIFKIQQCLRLVSELENGRGYLNYEDLETAIVRLKIPEQKIVANVQFLHSLQDRFMTVSEAIQVIQKVRKTKIKRKH